MNWCAWNRPRLTQCLQCIAASRWTAVRLSMRMTAIYEDDGAENDTMKRYDLRFHLNYRFDYWKGGENGVGLGEVHFMLVIDKTDGTQSLWSNGLVLGRGEVRRLE